MCTFYNREEVIYMDMLEDVRITIVLLHQEVKRLQKLVSEKDQRIADLSQRLCNALGRIAD